MKVQKLLQHPSIRGKMKPPVLVLAAAQSSGKSLFIDTILRFPVGYSRSGVGTRCPVLYMLRTGPRSSSINGVPVPLNELSTAVGNHMKNLGERFSDEYLNVEITSEDIPDLDILDTIGLVNKDQPHHNEAKRVLHKILKDDNTVVVAMLNSGKKDKDGNFETEVLDAVLREVRPNWRQEAIVIDNFVNLVLPQIHEPAELKAYLQPPMAAKHHGFVMLNPRNDHVEKMSVSQKTEWLKNLPSTEIEFLEENLRRILGKSGPNIRSSLPEHVQASLGITNTIDVLREVMRISVKRRIPALMEQVEQLLKTTEANLAVVMQRLDFTNVTRTKEFYQRYLKDYVAVVRSIYSNEDRSSPVVNPELYRSPEKWTLQPHEQFALNWDDEDDSCTNVRYRLPEQVSVERIREHLNNLPKSRTGLSELLGMRMIGRGALTRLQALYFLILLKMDEGQIDRDWATSKCLNPNEGVAGDCQAKPVIKALVRRALLRVSATVDWLCDHLECQFTNLGLFTERHLQEDEQYVAIRNHIGFHKLLGKKFDDHIRDKVKMLASSLRERIQEHAETVSLDIDYKLVALVTQIPFGSEVCGHHQFHRTVERTPAEDRFFGHPREPLDTPASSSQSSSRRKNNTKTPAQNNEQRRNEGITTAMWMEAALATCVAIVLEFCLLRFRDQLGRALYPLIALPVVLLGIYLFLRLPLSAVNVDAPYQAAAETPSQNTSNAAPVFKPAATEEQQGPSMIPGLNIVTRSTKNDPPVRSPAVAQRCAAIERLVNSLRSVKDELSLLDVVEGGVSTIPDQVAIDINPEAFQIDAQRFIYLAKNFLVHNMRSYVDYHLEREMLNQYFATFEGRMIEFFQSLQDDQVMMMQEEDFDQDALQEEKDGYEEEKKALENVRDELRRALRARSSPSHSSSKLENNDNKNFVNPSNKDKKKAKGKDIKEENKKKENTHDQRDNSEKVRTTTEEKPREIVKEPLKKETESGEAQIPPSM